jgi:hypothetical protein
MPSLLVIPKKFKGLQLQKELFGKMNVSNHELSLEEKEDLGLSIMMKKVDRNKKVPPETIMKELK